MLKLFKYLKHYTVPIIISLILIFFQSLSELYLPTLMADIVDTGIIKNDIGYIKKTGAIMLLVAIIGTICTAIASLLSSKISAGFGKILRREIFTKVENFSLFEFDKVGTASLITRTTNDITQIQLIAMIILQIMISAPMMCIGGIVMAVSKDAKMSLVLVFIVPILTATIIIIAKKGIPLFKSMQEKLDKLNLVLREGMTGIRVIRAFDRIDYENRRFRLTSEELSNTAVTVNKLISTLMPIVMLILNFSTIAIVWFGGIRIDQGSMQVGDVMAFIQYITLIMMSLIMVSIMFIMIPHAQASAVRINEVLEINPEITDPIHIKHPKKRSGFIEFKDVTFSYQGAEQPAISNISFTARPCEVTAIIGGTGSGKSTLVSLIPRFHDIDSGSILIDGIDVRDMDQEYLRSNMGFVPQNSLLFSGSIAENIKFGKQDASIEEIEHASKIAQASEFVNDMEEGFDSLIAQGGTNVSGGQKQRISIARALIRKAQIYIFDDTFSALDFKTDANLRMALKKETSDSTVIIVAQRINTILDADKIIVLDDGQIVGMGKHKELLDSCPVYREIVLSQLSEEESA